LGSLSQLTKARREVFPDILHQYGPMEMNLVCSVGTPTQFRWSTR